jgi:hypothetical protein
MNLDEFWSVYQCEFSSSTELQVAAFQVPTSLVPLAAANGISEHFKTFLKISSSKIWALKKICFENFQHFKNNTICAKATKVLGYEYYLFSEVL